METFLLLLFIDEGNPPAITHKGPNTVLDKFGGNLMKNTYHLLFYSIEMAISGLWHKTYYKRFNSLRPRQMDAISQTTFSNAFSWMKMFEFLFKFTGVCYQGSNYQYSSIGSDNGLAPSRRQAIIWTNGG